ncbi:MAG: hypothetical protein IKG01_09585 [Lachnospiraceae bacterium]|nr:hypothetical protein [Lachnospiraceae bacterium]
MHSKTFTSIAVSACLALGILAGCSGAVSVTGIPDEDVINSFGHNATVKSHTTEKLSDGDYSAKDTVSVSYKADCTGGLVKQTVTKELEFRLNKTSGTWEFTGEKLTACEVDNSSLPGSSWKCDPASSETVSALFGDEVPAGDNGVLYFRFLKKMGQFAFNLSNPDNTDSERFFGTVGTNAKAVWAGSSGNVEKSLSITEGSVTDDGDLYLVLTSDKGSAKINLGIDAVNIPEQDYDAATGKEVDTSKVYMDSLPVFEVTTMSIEGGEWRQPSGLKEGNESPELTWAPYDGATRYAVIMIDTSTSNWLCWFTVVDKTHLDEGEYTDPSVYAGPYPAETHTYELFVVALRTDPQALSFVIDASGGDIHSKLDFLNTAADGSTGNVLAYGTIKAPYTSPELYYGYR